MKFPATRAHGFTLIEMIVVILVIATLAALLVPAASRTLDRAKSAQAKNDLTQIVTAVNAFYTEYGKYPIATSDTALSSTDTADLFYTLRAISGGVANLNNAANPRKIVFISPRDLGTAANPRAGIGSDGQYYDPWGTTYKLAIDGNYDNQIDANPYGNNNGAGPQPLRQGVIVWSLGKDGQLGKVVGGQTVFTGSDDVISWK